MLIFNQLVFAKKGAEFRRANEEGLRIHGAYKKLPGGTIKLYKPDGTLDAAIIHNRYKEVFAVSAYTYSGDGRDRFMFAMSDQTSAWLSFSSLSFSEEQRAVRETVELPFDEFMEQFGAHVLDGRIQASAPSDERQQSDDAQESASRTMG